MSVPTRGSVSFLLAFAMGGCNVYDPGLVQDKGRVAPPLKAAGSAAPPTAEPGPVLDASALDDDAGSGMDPDTPAAPKQDASAPSEDITRCGDGKITGAETCDIAIDADKPGACPTECKELEHCVPRALSGTACQATCVVRQLLCSNGDGCCPGNCTAQNDDDCSAKCGDKIVQKESETCEPDTDTPCMTSVAECDDKNPCTTDTLLGSAKNCNTSCSHTPVTQPRARDGCCPMRANANTDSDCRPKCGNGVKEAGEECDGGMGCDATCKAIPLTDTQKCMAGFKDACGTCACMNCLSDMMACHLSSDAAFNTTCGGLVDCARKNKCMGADCLGTNTMPGPCQMLIETASGTNNPLTIFAMSGDPTTAVGRSTSLGDCVAAACTTECGMP